MAQGVGAATTGFQWRAQDPEIEAILDCWSELSQLRMMSLGRMLLHITVLSWNP